MGAARVRHKRYIHVIGTLTQSDCTEVHTPYFSWTLGAEVSKLFQGEIEKYEIQE